MPCLTTYVFDEGGTNDWTNPGPAPIPATGPFPISSPFHSATVAFAGTNVQEQRLGAGRGLSFVRPDRERCINVGAWFDTEGVRTQIAQLVPPNGPATFKPPIQTSYIMGAQATGPGRGQGGLEQLDARYVNTMLMTVNIPFHLNTPPGVAAVNGYVVCYVDLSLAKNRPVATVLGAAHPFAFESGELGAGQDEINAKLDLAIVPAIAAVQLVLNAQLLRAVAYDCSFLYLLPGIATPGHSPATGDASRDLTLVVSAEKPTAHAPPPPR